jgi:hypothetical protein
MRWRKEIEEKRLKDMHYGKRRRRRRTRRREVVVCRAVKRELKGQKRAWPTG